MNGLETIKEKYVPGNLGHHVAGNNKKEIQNER